MKILFPNKKSFIQNLYKAYTEGVYSDTPQNRKLGRVGMTYSQYAKKKYQEDEGGDKERNHDKKYYQEQIAKLGEKAYKEGKSEIPYLDEETRKLIKEAEKDWGINFSSDICTIWINAYYKALLSKLKEGKSQQSGISLNKELWIKNIFLESDLFKKYEYPIFKWQIGEKPITYIPSDCRLENVGEFSVIKTKDGDLVGGYHNGYSSLYLKPDYKIESKDNKYYIVKK